jgi:hypothetical protein
VFPAFRPPPPSPTTLAIVDLLHDRSKSGACVSCHREPFDDGAALVNENVIPRRRSSRSAPTSSARVRLRGRHRVWRDLVAQGVAFGAIAATPIRSGGTACPAPSQGRVAVDASGVRSPSSSSTGSASCPRAHDAADRQRPPGTTVE